MSSSRALSVVPPRARMTSPRNATVVPHKNIQPVANLFPDMESCAIIVRVLRKWPVYTAKGGNRPVSMELVLADKEGTKIEAHIDRPYIYKHGDPVDEGSVYSVSNFVVFVNHGEYRATRHEYKLNLKYHAEVRPAEPQEVPIPPYRFTAPEECFQKDFNRMYLVDVAGVILGVGQERELNTPSGKTTKLILDLDNRGYRFSVTLWGDYAAELKTFIAAGCAATAVVVILFAKVTSWTGGISIQTTMRTTKLLFNPDIPETAALCDAMSNTQALTVTPMTVTPSTSSGSAQQIFLSMDQKHTLADCRALIEVNEFVSIAKIHSVFDDVDWWYLACRCGRKCSKEDDVPDLYYCPGCNIHVTRVTRKFFIKVLLIDETESITAVLFDNTARILIGRSAEEVYQSWFQDPARDFLPSVVAGLNGKEALFRIQADQKEGGRFPRSYRVKNVSDDIQLINDYIAKWDSEAAIDINQQVLLIEDTPESAPVMGLKSAEVVSQNLNCRFDASASDSVSVGTASKVVDITRDTDDTPPPKRKSPSDETTPSTAPIKTVKVEK